MNATFRSHNLNLEECSEALVLGSSAKELKPVSSYIQNALSNTHTTLSPAGKENGVKIILQMAQFRDFRRHSSCTEPVCVTVDN